MKATTAKRFTQGQFSWVDLNAHDLESTASFYAELFGWRVESQDTEDGPPYAMCFLNGDVVAGIGEMSDDMRAGSVPPAWNSYVYVDDIHAMTEHATQLGATVVAAPIQVLDAGWLAFIEDPTGATVGLWQSTGFRGAERVNTPGSFCWNELNTRDLDGARDFFHELLGWTYEDNSDSPAPYAIIQNDSHDNGGILQMNEEWSEVPPHWMVYFASQDVDADVHRLQDLGGTLHHGPFDTEVGRIAVVADPQGAVFHLITLSDPVA